MREDYEMFHLSDGENIVRILPPTWKNPSHYGLDVYIHRIDSMVYFCDVGACCNVGGKSFKKVLTWVIHEGKLKLWIMPLILDKMLVQRMVSDKRWKECISKNYSLIVHKTGYGIKTSFYIENLIKTNENKGTDKILEYTSVHPLDMVKRDFYYNEFINKVKKVLKNESLL
jgi:hypothetical protein